MFTKLLAFKKAYIEDASGATAIEYGMISAGLAVIIVAVIAIFGPAMTASFQSLGEVIGDQTANIDPLAAQ